MTSNNDNTHQEGPFRVDLTSQDLRTGIVRLPRQLLDRFESGPLAAASRDAGEKLQLEFRAPRELHGLQDYFRDHNLRTNDAINIYIDTDGLSLEPFYRNRRRSEVRNQRKQAPAEEPVEQSGTGSPEAQPTESPVDSATEPDTPVSSEAAEKPTIPAAVASQPDAADAFDDFGDFEDLGELDPLDMGLDVEPDSVEQTAEEAFGEAAATEPGQVTSPESDPAATAQTPAQDGSDAFHVTSRRPFLLGVDRRADVQTADRPRQDTASNETDGRAITSSEGAAPQERVRRHLNEPGLPSILQEAQVVAATGLPADAVAAALSELSQEPDSRLSTIRPGFWLLRQPEQE